MCCLLGCCCLCACIDRVSTPCLCVCSWACLALPCVVLCCVVLLCVVGGAGGGDVSQRGHLQQGRQAAAHRGRQGLSGAARRGAEESRTELSWAGRCRRGNPSRSHLLSRARLIDCYESGWLSSLAGLLRRSFACGNACCVRACEPCSRDRARRTAAPTPRLAERRTTWLLLVRGHKRRRQLSMCSCFFSECSILKSRND